MLEEGQEAPMSTRSEIRCGLAAALLALMGLVLSPCASASTEPSPTPSPPRPYISVPGHPYGVAISPDGGHAYVTTTGWPEALVVTDTHTKQQSARIWTGGVDVGISPDGRRAYTTVQAAWSANDWQLRPGSVKVFDTATNTEIDYIKVGVNPVGLAVAPDGRRVYVANSGSDSLSVVDTASGKVVDEVKVGSDPVHVVASPDGRHVYVANSGYGTPASLSVIDTATDKVVGWPGRLGDFTYGLAVTPDGRRLYVTDLLGTVSVVDTATGKVTGGPIPVGWHPKDVVVSADGRRAYVANEGADSLSVIDTSTNKVTETISAHHPTRIALTRDGRHAWITEYWGGRVWVVDL
ncbi:cytochrome D1 domain-containing protein [Streptomyces sp. NPDC001594]|uniref:YncE family protein n=1 Tax=Streptomyces sp. NPDC001594 TaxID=3364590 RepID=UPI00367DD702